jgi:hypothetical protein
LGICLCSTIRGMPGDRPSRSLDASLVIPTCVLRLEASWHARISSPPVEPPVLVLWFNQVTRPVLWWTTANPTCRLWSWAATLHRVLSTTSSCFSCQHVARTWPRWPPGPSSLLVSPLLGGPARHQPFALALHLNQRKSSHNLHLQYSANSQSTPHCQSLIIARSDHPPVLGCSGPQSPPWWVHWKHTKVTNSKKREKEKKRTKNSDKWSKVKQMPRKDHLRERKSRSPKASATTRHNRDKMLPNCRLLKMRQKGSTPLTKEHN